jgi:hypothetical protein
MILLLGDSNLRNTLEANRERLSAAVGEEINFKMTTTTESIKLALNATDQEPKIIFIHTPLNEVVRIVSKNQAKGRDETLRAVIEEQNRIVHLSAAAKPTVLHVLIPPFLRMDPPWISTKIRLGLFYVKDYLTASSPWNIVVANSIDITGGDLDDDKVHLNSLGKEKLYQALETDILKCKASLGDGSAALSQDWASQMDEGYEPPTPNTLRKRPRPTTEQGEEEEEEEYGSRKKAKLVTILDKIDSLVKEIKQERTENKVEIAKVNDKVDLNTAAIKENVEQISTIKEAIKSDNNLTAEIKEDLDGLENENLKQTIIVRKLKAVDPVPKDKKQLRAYIQSVARATVGKILDMDSVKLVKYAAPLYTFIDPTKKDNREGLVPPFKIGFATKDTAIKFKEEAVKKSKEIDSEYKSTYFTYFQASGTRIRTLLMWAIADALKTDSRESWVTQNSPRPVLQVKEEGKIIETLGFVKAMGKYKEKIPKKALDEAKKLAQKSFSGNIEKIFLVIKD